MSGPAQCFGPRGVRRGAALTLVFATVLATAAATGSLPHGAAKSSDTATRYAASTIESDKVADAAARAVADGKSGKEAAEEVVSRSGDRWGAVYDERQYEEFEQALDGSYTGVGIAARRSAEGRVEVARVQPGSPADRAGIEPGDLLRTVDGHRVDERPVAEVVALLRGDRTEASAGSTVVLGVQRGAALRTETLRRATLSTEAVTVRRIGPDRSDPAPAVLIEVDSFTRGSGDRVRDAVRDAPAGAGVLLDLRGNSGGLVTEAVTAASAFLDGGLVATYDVHGEQRALYAQPGGDTVRPLVVLIDGGTMSAAELLTGALQDRGRAVTVGSRTFGKGSVQMPSKLPGGSVAELTVGHYRTPAGRGVDGHGITPDLAVTSRAERRAETVLSGLGGGS
ncbi:MULTISPECIES: S41 family peptidase [unclassified Streptomyces]|uniref:S41 family peptidase n=1 Tax=unclassified Streptomyces TaxID=2593676 RepID=UPI002251E47C|nr:MULTISPECIES: S41 family peptidase [unclassified Streptomyces]WSP55371.1 S41 family peptidase [Streptomyces sp. NBC_01241]WSU23899.1 S41 family peptidase [Streptomyces sp. NBC_01108]MCX4787050.1 S41 family peptidase [Streptomyces sp. NBC_01221]MCX4797168.1 S41 family peptidase [Streptomyces sp. NBC_01242]WSJ38463.1 S41 family peptidase [Streptomyces sp. NBC_01321]